MGEERKLILEMLSEGKINVMEAQKLLEEAEFSQEEPIVTKPLNKQFIKILIVEGDNTKVNVNLPLALAEAGLKLVPKNMLNINGREINGEEILKLISEGAKGELVNIETKEKDKEVKVRIIVE